MPREIAIGGMLMPGLLLVFLVCVALLWLAERFAGRQGWYRYMWHPSLVRIALFIIVFGALGLILV